MMQLRISVDMTNIAYQNVGRLNVSRDVARAVDNLLFMPERRTVLVTDINGNSTGSVSLIKEVNL